VTRRGIEHYYSSAASRNDCRRYLRHERFPRFQFKHPLEQTGEDKEKKNNVEEEKREHDAEPRETSSFEIGISDGADAASFVLLFFYPSLWLIGSAGHGHETNGPIFKRLSRHALLRIVTAPSTQVLQQIGQRTNQHSTTAPIKVKDTLIRYCGLIRTRE